MPPRDQKDLARESHATMVLQVSYETAVDTRLTVLKGINNAKSFKNKLDELKAHLAEVALEGTANMLVLTGMARAALNIHLTKPAIDEEFLRRLVFTSYQVRIRNLTQTGDKGKSAEVEADRGRYLTSMGRNLGNITEITTAELEELRVVEQ